MKLIFLVGFLLLIIQQQCNAAQPVSIGPNNVPITTTPTKSAIPASTAPIAPNKVPTSVPLAKSAIPAPVAPKKKKRLKKLKKKIKAPFKKKDIKISKPTFVSKAGLDENKSKQIENLNKEIAQVKQESKAAKAAGQTKEQRAEIKQAKNILIDQRQKIIDNSRKADYKKAGIKPSTGPKKPAEKGYNVINTKKPSISQTVKAKMFGPHK